MLFGLFCYWSNEALIFESVGQVYMKAEPGVIESYSAMPFIFCLFHIFSQVLFQENMSLWHSARGNIKHYSDIFSDLPE